MKRLNTRSLLGLLLLAQGACSTSTTAPSVPTSDTGGGFWSKNDVGSINDVGHIEEESDDAGTERCEAVDLTMMLPDVDGIVRVSGDNEANVLPTIAAPDSCVIGDEVASPVFFRYRMRQRGAVEVSTSNPGTGSTFDTVVLIAERCGSGSPLLGCSDDISSDNLRSLARLGGPIEAGHDLYIVVGGFPRPSEGYRSTGGFELTIREVPALEPDGGVGVDDAGSDVGVDDAGSDVGADDAGSDVGADDAGSDVGPATGMDVGPATGMDVGPATGMDVGPMCRTQSQACSDTMRCCDSVFVLGHGPVPLICQAGICVVDPVACPTCGTQMCRTGGGGCTSNTQCCVALGLRCGTPGQALNGRCCYPDGYATSDVMSCCSGRADGLYCTSVPPPTCLNSNSAGTCTGAVGTQGNCCVDLRCGPAAGSSSNRCCVPQTGRCNDTTQRCCRGLTCGSDGRCTLEPVCTVGPECTTAVNSSSTLPRCCPGLTCSGLGFSRPRCCVELTANDQNACRETTECCGYNTRGTECGRTGVTAGRCCQPVRTSCSPSAGCCDGTRCGSIGGLSRCCVGEGGRATAQADCCDPFTYFSSTRTCQRPCALTEGQLCYPTSVGPMCCMGGRRCANSGDGNTCCSEFNGECDLRLPGSPGCCGSLACNFGRCQTPAIAGQRCSNDYSCAGTLRCVSGICR